MCGDVRDTQPKGKERIGKRENEEKEKKKESESVSVPLLYPMKDKRGVYSEILYHIKERVYL